MVAGSGRQREVARERPAGDRFADDARPVCHRRRAHRHGDAAQAGQARACQSRHAAGADFQQQAGQAACYARGSLGPGMAQDQYGRKRRLHGHETFKTGEQLVLRRNDDWKAGRGGQLPFFKRIIEQTVPDPATRANLIEKGDADIATDLQASDVLALQSRGKLRVDSTPQSNGFTMIAFNTQAAPFDNVKVRQAIAAALPYDDMFAAAIFKRGYALFGASWTEPPTGNFPQPMPVKTDIAKAKQLLAEAGVPAGFKTTFTINVGSAAITEPMAALIKESLAKIGIEVDIQKLPDAQMSTAIAEKRLPFFTEGSTAWLPTTDYFFRNFFTVDQRWNYSSWNDALVTELGAKARFELDSAKYEEMSKQMIAEYTKEMPLVLLWQANQDAVMVPGLDGYTYWFHRQLDFRDLSRK